MFTDITHPDKNPILSLKQILFLIAVTFAIATTLLIILFTSAATEIGSTPFSAISLIDGANSGILGSNEQRWFRMVPNEQSQAAIVEKSLRLSLTPINENLSQHVSLQLFEADQIQFYIPDDTSQMTSIGASQVIVDGDNPKTGELYWTGSIADDSTYYIYVRNTSNVSLDYTLITEDMSSETVEAEPAVIEPSQPVAVPELGTNASNAFTLAPDMNQGHLQPRSTSWYRFVFDDFSDGNNFQDLGFSLYFTPDNGNRGRYVNFELFTANEVASWGSGDADRLTNFGAGMLVSRDGDINTGERLWKGTVVKGDTYFLVVENSAEVEIDYWLFNGIKYNPELGSKPEPAPAPVFSSGMAPQSAIPLSADRNQGGLDPGQEVWYSFSIHNNDSEFFEEMALTMIATPDDGNRIHHINFDVFKADAVRDWSPGDNSKINNVGAGGIVVRDNNPLTGELFWSGWVVEDDLYYVQIRNGTNIHIDYWLFNGDVYAPALGPDPTNN